MAFPITKRYFFRYLHSNTGLTPTFLYFKRADTLAAVAAPTVTEVGGGTYYFDWTWTALTDPDIVYEVDGGVSIPTESVRYVSGKISVQDVLLDQSISSVGDGVLRALGLLHENSVFDQSTFDVNNNLLSARVRIYNSKANADAASAASPAAYNTGKVAEYLITASYVPSTPNLTKYTVTREA